MLRQWHWLREELASTGVANLHAIIVADDENLELAEQYGFGSVECPNDQMGRKWNAGFEAAADADFLVLVGSDNWVHPDTFGALWQDHVSCASTLDFVDLPRGVLQHAAAPELIPWVIPRSLFRGNFSPLPDRMQRGTEAMLRGALQHPPFVHRVGATSVNFNTAESVSPYAGVANSIGDGIEHDAWSALSSFPAHLVQAARQLSEEIA